VAKTPKVMLEIAGREVAISNPDKPYFPRAGHGKLAVVQYYLAVADGALRGAGGRPNVLKRYVDGAEGEAFYQKRAPESRPDWLETTVLSFPSGRTAEEVVPRDAAALAWMVNLGCLELHPHPVRAEDLDHPDEMRIDLDPVPGIAWPQLQEVARKEKDVIKLNCVNDKLLQLKQLMNIADQARTNLEEAIARKDEEARYHEFGRITIASQQAQVLGSEAENCVGEDLTFLGPTQVIVDEPELPDDPTVPVGPDFPIVEPLPVASPQA
jgi:hypothetical protein